MHTNNYYSLSDLDFQICFQHHMVYTVLVHHKIHQRNGKFKPWVLLCIVALDWMIGDMYDPAVDIVFQKHILF